MECPVCGHDRQEILPGPKRFANHEYRDARCKECGKLLLLKSTIEGVYDTNPNTLKEEVVPISRYDDAYREYHLGRRAHPRYTGGSDA